MLHIIEIMTIETIQHVYKLAQPYAMQQIYCLSHTFKYIFKRYYLDNESNVCQFVNISLRI